MSEPEPTHRMVGKFRASLNIEIRNGPSLWAVGEHLTTEEAVEFLASILPVVPASRVKEGTDERA